MISAIFYFCMSLLMTGYCVHLLYVAATQGYVMALTRPFSDTVETRQTREENPQKFWANVIIAVLLLPLSLGSVWLFSEELYRVLLLQDL